MEQNIYTNDPNVITADISDHLQINLSDIVMLNGNNIIQTVDAEISTINPIPSFDLVKNLSICVSATTDDISANFLDKRTGGEISGDVNILSGNYIQTSTPESVHVYSNKNAFIQAEDTGYGDAFTGTKGFCVLSVFPDTNELLVSGDIPEWMQSPTSNKYGDDETNLTAAIKSSTTVKYSMIDSSKINPVLSDLLWSIELEDQSKGNFSNIIAINVAEHKIQFESLPNVIKNIASKPYTQEKYINWFNGEDDNGLYVAGFPKLGNQSIINFHTQHVEGGSTKAIGACSHAEGCDTMAANRYSHAEGQYTYAGGAESHSEGIFSIAQGNASHAEGKNTIANEVFSHAEGNGSNAFGRAAHAEGLSVYANGDGSHAEGYQTSAIGKYSHSEGYQTVAQNTDAHAEGNSTSAIGKNSHAEGINSVAEGVASHAEGGNTYAKGNYSHAEGYAVSAIGNYSHAAGNKAIASGLTSYIWNGSGTQQINDINGSFAIWPKNGLSGFYVSGESLGTTLNKIQQDTSTSVTILENDINHLSNAISSLQIDVTAISSNVAIISGNVSTLSSTKQDKLSSIQMSAINIAASKIEPKTIITFANGDISAYDFSGRITYVTLSDEHLRGGDAHNPEWLCAITNVKIGYDVSAIDAYIFNKCSSLTSVTLPESVVKIGNSALKECYNLQKILLTPNTQEISSNALIGCTSLTGIYIKDSTQEYATELSNTIFAGKLPSSNCKVIGYGSYDINKEYVDSQDSALSIDLVNKIKNSLSGMSSLTSFDQVQYSHVAEALFNLAQVFGA